MLIGIVNISYKADLEELKQVLSPIDMDLKYCADTNDVFRFQTMAQAGGYPAYDATPGQWVKRNTLKSSLFKVFDELPATHTMIPIINQETELIAIEKEKYIDRKSEGEDYAETMDARLILMAANLNAAGVPLATCEDIRAELDGMFNGARFEVSFGRWISAKRVIDTVIPSPSLQTIVDTYGLGENIDQPEIIQEVVDRINLAILELY